MIMMIMIMLKIIMIIMIITTNLVVKINLGECEESTPANNQECE